MNRLIYLFILVFFIFSCSENNYFFTEDPVNHSLDFNNAAKIKEHYKRGKYLTSTVGSCGHCHGVNLAGNPNITSDVNTGIGSWKVDQIVSVLKGGPKKNGKLPDEDVHVGMQWISDYDARSIAIYLLSTKPVRSVERDENKSLLDTFSSRSNVKGFVLNPKQNANASYGRYLTYNVASCQTCHGDSLEGTENAPRLKKKISKWSKEQIISYLETGSTPKGSKINPKDCPWPYYRLADTIDKQAIAFFLKTLL